MSEEIKKIRISDLPTSSSVNDEDIFIKSDNMETSKIAAGDIAEYVTKKVPIYTHPDSGVIAGTYRSVTVDKYGHVTAGSIPTTLSGYGITDAATKSQGEKADTAVQSVKIGTTEYKSDTTVILPDYPTSLPASDVYEWAKAETKPAYTASEIGADESGSANTAYENAKSYTNTKISELINGAPSTLDTLGEIAEAMSDNQDVVEALDSAIGTKADQAALNEHTGNATIHTTAAEKNKLSGIETGAQKNTLTGVKGNAESSYRTGNVNITPANIGLGSVNNTADSEKSVKYAASAGNANTAVAVVDYGDPSQTIKIGYSGSGGNTDNLNYIAGYISGGSQPQIKDVPKNVLQAWLGLGSAAYTSSDNYISTSASCNKNWNWIGQSSQPPWVWGSSDGTNMYVWNPSNFSVNYASSAGSVAWDNVSGKPSSYTPSNHSHSYLPLSGGTLTGAVNFANNTWNKVGDDVMIGDCNIGGMLGIKSSGNGDTGIYMWGKSSGSAPACKMGSDSRTLFLYGTSYLNLCSPGIQCRSYDDNSWAGISFSSYTTQGNSSRKLKDNIKDITDERARQILDVNIVTFDYKEGIVAEDHRYDRTGVIAEDTENVCPEVINYDNNEPSGVQYDRFIPYLIRMVQLQQEEIDRLKADMQQLANAD